MFYHVGLLFYSVSAFSADESQILLGWHWFKYFCWALYGCMVTFNILYHIFLITFLMTAVGTLNWFTYLCWTKDCLVFNFHMFYDTFFILFLVAKHCALELYDLRVLIQLCCLWLLWCLFVVCFSVNIQYYSMTKCFLILLANILFVPFLWHLVWENFFTILTAVDFQHMLLYSGGRVT